jgi:hypothetical protein
MTAELLQSDANMLRHWCKTSYNLGSPLVLKSSVLGIGLLTMSRSVVIPVFLDYRNVLITHGRLVQYCYNNDACFFTDAAILSGRQPWRKEVEKKIDRKYPEENVGQVLYLLSSQG